MIIYADSVCISNMGLIHYIPIIITCISRIEAVIYLTWWICPDDARVLTRQLRPNDICLMTSSSHHHHLNLSLYGRGHRLSSSTIQWNEGIQLNISSGRLVFNDDEYTRR